MKVLWLTGLSGSGKTTIANTLASTKNIIVLDGDALRNGLNSDLGFSMEDRTENVRRVAEIAKELSKTHIIAVALISPLESMRKLAKRIIGDDYIEIYCSASLDVCEQRDVKGLYKKARDGKLAQFTGIGSGYEIPSNPDIILDTTKPLEESINTINQLLNNEVYSLVLGLKQNDKVVLHEFDNLHNASLARLMVGAAVLFHNEAKSISIQNSNGDALVYQTFEELPKLQITSTPGNTNELV